LGIEFIIVGVFVGFLSGFFGIGGGTVLVPILMALGLGIKEAVGVSVTQMVFSSLYGSYLNFKKGMFKLNEGIYLGLGGALGALGSGYFLSVVDALVLEVMFLGFLLFAFYRFFKKDPHISSQKELPKALLFFTGAFVGLLAISIGVGGSILVTPILVGLYHLDIKKAVSMGLFFVIFSSVSGFLSLSFFGHVNYLYGIAVGLSSLLGVHFGIKAAHRIDRAKLKKLLLILYGFIFLLVVKEIFHL